MIELKQAIIKVLLSPIHTVTVWAIGIYTLLWGIWVVNPFWSVFDKAVLFSALGLIAPEVFWGSFAITCSFIIMWGALHRSIRSLMIGANVAGFHWTMIACFYFIGDWQNTGGITSLCIALYAGYVWLNLRVNSKYRGLHDDDIIL